MSTRRVIAWISGVSLDGFTSGPGGPRHDSWLHDHAGREQTAEYFEAVWRGADTIVLGRTNYEGFHGVWPGITADPATDPRNREVGRWLAATQKVVASTTLTETTWENSQITRDPVSTVDELRQREGRDIIVLNSASVIHSLLRADLVDDLRTMLVPVTLGAGLRLLPEGLPSARWTLAGATVLAHGAVGLHHRRDHDVVAT